MIVIGLTGGIGMGKSTAAALLREFGFPVHHSDRAVHCLLRKAGAAVKPIARFFPETLVRGAIDRKKLGSIVFGKPEKLRQLEKILHPLVQRSEKKFLQIARKQKKAAAILEIPLLFETNAQKRCDYVICVTAPHAVQKARVMQRPGMTAKKLKAILARQMPDKQKRKLADFVLHTGTNHEATKKQLHRVLKTILKG